MRVPSEIVSFGVMGSGKSASKLFVAVNALLVPLPESALGNVVGSTIANLLLVVALTLPFAASSKKDGERAQIGQDLASVLPTCPYATPDRDLYGEGDFCFTSGPVGNGSRSALCFGRNVS